TYRRFDTEYGWPHWRLYAKYGWLDWRFDTEHRYAHGRHGDNPGRLDGLYAECRNDHRRVNPEHGHNNRWHNADHGCFHDGRRNDRLDHGHGRNVDHNGWLVYFNRRFLDKHRWLFEQHGRFFYFNRRFFL
ncbi:MAG: hypothetical protein HXO80_06135, partial [Selenomonas sp.]|nr:hypothetical protein [Selenomonas sp.]